MRKGSGLIILFIISLFFCLPVDLNAEWSTDPEQNNLICSAINNQHEPCIAGDGNGGAVICWRDYRDEESIFGGDIYAQYIDFTGNIGWQQDGVSVFSGINGQFQPRIINSGTGDNIIIWNSNLGGFYNYDIYAQGMDFNGNLLWNTNGIVITDTTGTEFNHVMISDGNGGVIICWQHFLGFGSELNLYAQHLDNNGLTLWSGDGNVVCEATENQMDPAICEDGNGGAIIAWLDDRNEDNSPDIYAQRISAEGAVQWTADGLMICGNSSPQSEPRICSDGNGGAVIIWKDNRNDEGDIYAQRVDNTGQLFWTNDGIPVCSVNGAQSNPQIVYDNNEGVIVVWEDHRYGMESDIFAQKVNLDGSLAWNADGIPVNTLADNQIEPRIICDEESYAIIVFRDYRSDEWGDIYAQRLDPAGNTLWTVNGEEVCTASGEQSWHRITADGSSGAVITWADNRDSELDIYAQWIDLNGNLGGESDSDENTCPGLTDFWLGQNQPNPFNPSTTISYYVGDGSRIEISLFNLRGQKLITLVDTYRKIGTYQVSWDGKNSVGDRVDSGLYFYKLKANGSDKVVQKMILLK